MHIRCTSDAHQMHMTRAVFAGGDGVHEEAQQDLTIAGDGSQSIDKVRNTRLKIRLAACVSIP
jgi:hypothetical protein